MSSMNVDRRDAVLRVLLLIGICVSGAANVLPNGNGVSLYCSKFSGEGLKACKYGLYVGTHPQLYPDLANKNFPSYCKGMCEKKSESVVYGRQCTTACVYAGGEIEKNRSAERNRSAVADQVKQRILEQFTTSPGNVFNKTTISNNRTRPGANTVDQDARSKGTLTTKNDDDTLKVVLASSTKREIVSRELSKQEQSIENSTDAASVDLKRLLGEREADSLKKIELKQNSLKDGLRLNKSAVDEELKNLVEHESKLDSAIQVARAKLAKLRQESEEATKKMRAQLEKEKKQEAEAKGVLDAHSELVKKNLSAIAKKKAVQELEKLKKPDMNRTVRHLETVKEAIDSESNFTGESLTSESHENRTHAVALNIEKKHRVAKLAEETEKKKVGESALKRKEKMKRYLEHYPESNRRNETRESHQSLKAKPEVKQANLSGSTTKTPQGPVSHIKLNNQSADDLIAGLKEVEAEEAELEKNASKGSATGNNAVGTVLSTSSATGNNVVTTSATGNNAVGTVLSTSSATGNNVVTTSATGNNAGGTVLSATAIDIHDDLPSLDHLISSISGAASTTTTGSTGLTGGTARTSKTGNDDLVGGTEGTSTSMTGNYDHDEGAEGTGIAGNNESEWGTAAGSMTGSHGSKKRSKQIKKIAELLLARSIQNHILNVTGLPDLDRALLVNPKINKIVRRMSRKNGIAVNALIMDEMKKIIHPQRLFHQQNLQKTFHSIRELLKHMKEEDNDILGQDVKRKDETKEVSGKQATPPKRNKTVLERTRNAVRELMDKVEAENRNDEIEYKGFKDLRGLFEAHLGATKKIEERQNLKGLFNSHLHTDLHHELKTADDAANEVIRRLESNAGNLLSSGLSNKTPLQADTKQSRIEHAPSVNKLVQEAKLALENSDNLAKKDVYTSEKKPEKHHFLKPFFSPYASSMKLCQWMNRIGYCNESVCHSRCTNRGKWKVHIRKKCLPQYYECMMNEHITFEKCVNNMDKCSSGRRNPIVYRLRRL